MLMTRLGYGSKMVVTGDPVQSDVNGKSRFAACYVRNYSIIIGTIVSFTIL